MTVRAKMRLISITNTEYTSKIVKFVTQYDDTIPEDMRFQKATPSGSVEMYVDNPIALEQFEIGKTYYLDFNKAE